MKQTTLSPRRRRLRWTAALLLTAALAGAAGLFWKVGASRPQEYRPDEKNADITSELARKLPAGTPKPCFTDVTRTAGLAGFRTFMGERTSQLPEDMGSGAAWGDFDNDGFEDLFLVSAGGPLGAPTNQLGRCELYRNKGDGTFERVEAFPELRIHGMAAAWGDYDNDGYLDLIVTGYNSLLLFHNERGTGKFVLDPGLPNLPGFWSSATWGDFDNDRNPDLYVCGYVQYVHNEVDRSRISAQLGTAVPYTLNPASYEPARNLLFHNNGDGTFTEVADKLGVSNPKGRSLGGLWHDFDEDGWLDLYVANDISDNAFYHNTGGKFEDCSYSACVADYRSAMGLAAGDWARRGYDDLFVSHWVGQQNALFHNLWSDLGPTNTPAGGRFRLTFMDIADIKGLGQISLPCIGWGTEFFDFDNDGWLDLIVANGSTLEMEGSPPRKLQPQQPFLFWNQQGEYFHNVSPLCPALSEAHVSRGLAVADYNQDGTLDVLLMHLGEGAQLLRNDLHTGNWVNVRLRSKSPSGALVGFGDGSTVIAHLRQGAMRRTVSSASYLSQNSRVLHFGLGSTMQVEQLEVRWHAGQTNFYSNLAANQLWELTEGEPTPKATYLRRTAGSPQSPREHLSVATKTAPHPLDKSKTVEFWNYERSAMDALKREQNIPQAIELFRAALTLDPNHEDSRYYLSQCLASQGETQSALEQLDALKRINPQSHRAFQEYGALRAICARSEVDLVAAQESLEKALALNPEETGSLLLLGEVALLRGDSRKAEDTLTAACRTNPRAAGGFFLRGYLAWSEGDANRAAQLLTETRQALGKEWQPKGATAEGDVKHKQFADSSPLCRFWESWDGELEPRGAFASLQSFLSGSGR